MLKLNHAVRVHKCTYRARPTVYYVNAVGSVVSSDLKAIVIVPFIGILKAVLVLKRKTLKSLEGAKAAKLAHKEDMIENERLDTELDKCMMELFNAISCCNGGTFKIPESRDISDARKITLGWAPQLHGPISDPSKTARQYILSKFFSRYLSSVELQNGLVASLKGEATLAFLETNLEGESLDFSPGAIPELDDCLDWMTAHISSTLGYLDVEKVFKSCKHGANGTASIKRSESYLDSKYLSISGSHRALEQLVHYSFWDVQLREYLMEHSAEFRSISNGVPIDSELINDATQELFVPKSYKAVRGVCPEREVPAYHSQGLATHMTRKLAMVDINLNLQPSLHQLFAYFASFCAQMDMGTLDFSEASNRIWTGLVKRVLREEWFSYANDYCRSKDIIVVLGSVKSGKVTLEDIKESKKYKDFAKYGKLDLRPINGSWNEIIVTIHSTIFCTMGNALTFPLQTLIFHSFLSYCSRQALIEERVPVSYLDQHPELFYVSSFGDDGILNAGALPMVRKLAPLLGWVVNEEKTFGRGDWFRESCGGDYLYGVGCRPLMLKRPDALLDATPKETCKHFQAWLYNAANAALELCNDTLHGDPDLIYSWLEKCHKRFNLGKICLVPPSLPSGAGLRVPYVGAYWELFFDHRLYNIPVWTAMPDRLLSTDQALAQAFATLEPGSLPVYKAFKFFRMIYRPFKSVVYSEYPYMHTSMKGAPASISFDDNYLGYDSSILTIDSTGCVAAKVQGRTQKVSYYNLSWL